MTGLERENTVMEYVLREMSQKKNDLDDDDETKHWGDSSDKATRIDRSDLWLLMNEEDAVAGRPRVTGWLGESWLSQKLWLAAVSNLGKWQLIDIG